MIYTLNCKSLCKFALRFLVPTLEGAPRLIWSRDLPVTWLFGSTLPVHSEAKLAVMIFPKI